MKRALLPAIALLLVGCATGGAPSPSDAQQLLALHEEVMRAHRESDVDLLLKAEGDDYVVAGRGEITRPDRNARRERLGPYLTATRFSTYADKVPPIVKVSSDGSLGWVIVQVEARGEQTAPSGSRPAPRVRERVDRALREERRPLGAGRQRVELQTRGGGRGIIRP